MPKADPIQQRLESILGKEVIPPGTHYDYMVQLQRPGLLGVAKFCHDHRGDMTQVSRGDLRYPLICCHSRTNKISFDAEVISRKPDESFEFIEKHQEKLLQAMNGERKERGAEGRGERR
jgi:hypothetical protein